jgi:hypothetical protein
LCVSMPIARQWSIIISLRAVAKSSWWRSWSAFMTTKKIKKKKGKNPTKKP